MPYLFNYVTGDSISGYMFSLDKINLKWWAWPIEYFISNLKNHYVST